MPPHANAERSEPSWVLPHSKMRRPITTRRATQFILSRSGSFAHSRSLKQLVSACKLSCFAAVPLRNNDEAFGYTALIDTWAGAPNRDEQPAAPHSLCSVFILTVQSSVELITSSTLCHCMSGWHWLDDSDRTQNACTSAAQVVVIVDQGDSPGTPGTSCSRRRCIGRCGRRDCCTPWQC